MRTFVVGLTTLLIVTSVLHHRAEADTGDCASTSNRVALSCLLASMQAGPWGGLYARRNSADLNISQAEALAGRWFQHAMWLYNRSGFPDYTWLELADTAGFAGRWERHWIWIDGTSGYVEHDIQQSPNDDLLYAYQISWSGSGSTEGWKLYINGGQVAGYPVTPVITWIQPSQMSSQKAAVGFETPSVTFPLDGSGNSQSNTRNGSNAVETFRTDSLQVMDSTCCVWRSWLSNKAQVDGPQPCTGTSGYACYNGESATGGPTTWNANKPQ